MPNLLLQRLLSFPTTAFSVMNIYHEMDQLRMLIGIEQWRPEYCTVNSNKSQIVVFLTTINRFYTLQNR